MSQNLQRCLAYNKETETSLYMNSKNKKTICIFFVMPRKVTRMCTTSVIISFWFLRNKKCCFSQVWIYKTGLTSLCAFVLHFNRIKRHKTFNFWYCWLLNEKPSQCAKQFLIVKLFSNTFSSFPKKIVWVKFWCKYSCLQV